MVEDCNKLDTENLGGELINHELYKTANSLFRELFGVELWFKELQCLTQQELCSFVQSSENLKKLYNAKIIDINLNDNEDEVKDDLRMDIEEYIKPIVERYWTNDKLFDTILYVNDLLGKYSWGKIAITDLSELMDFFSEHIIDKVKFDILKKLSEEYDFTPMNIKYKVITVENYLNWKIWDIPLEVNYKKIERESILLECREKWCWINKYGRIIPLDYCWRHSYNAEIIIWDDESLSRKFSEYKWNDFSDFLVLECGWVKLTGKKYFSKFTEFERANSYFSFPINSITNRPQITPKQLDTIFDICGTIPKELA